MHPRGRRRGCGRWAEAPHGQDTGRKRWTASVRPARRRAPRPPSPCAWIRLVGFKFEHLRPSWLLPRVPTRASRVVEVATRAACIPHVRVVIIRASEATASEPSRSQRAVGCRNGLQSVFDGTARVVVEMAGAARPRQHTISRRLDSGRAGGVMGRCAASSRVVLAATASPSTLLRHSWQRT